MTPSYPNKASVSVRIIYLREEAVKRSLILSSDKIIEKNFTKLCTLKFVLLDVSLSFTTGCNLVALFARDRPKNNYLCTLPVLPSENLLSQILLHPLGSLKHIKLARSMIRVGHILNLILNLNLK